MKIYLKCDFLNQWMGVIKARINEGINQVTMINLELVTKEELPQDGLEKLIGKPITVFVEDTIAGKHHKSRWDCVIFELIDVASGKNDNGNFFYTMVIRPSLWKLNYFSHSRSYTEKSRIEVIDELLEEHGFILDQSYTKGYRNEAVYPQFHQILQTGTSDLTFFHNTLANAGISYYFATDNDAENAECLRLVDDNAFFVKHKETIPIISTHGWTPDKDQRHIEAITRLTRAIPGTVSSTAFMGDGSTRSRTNAESQDKSGVDGQIQVFVPEGGKDIEGAARTAGKILSEGFTASRVVHKGVANHIRIRPGNRIPLKSYDTAREYELLVVNVQHSFYQSVNAALSDSGSGSCAYKNYFVAVEPYSNVRPSVSTHSTDVDIELSLEEVLDLDIEGKLSINPKFQFKPNFNFNPSLDVEVNVKAIGFLLAAIANIQAQIIALRAKINALGPGSARGGGGLVAAVVEENAYVSSGKELVCKVSSEEFLNPITAKIAVTWHTTSGGTHFLPRKGNHVWIMRINRSHGNDWVVVGYRPSATVNVANDPAKTTTIKALKEEGPPAFESSTGSIIADAPFTVSNFHRLGIMGEGNASEMFVSDDKGDVVTRANNNIYLQAAKEHHMASEKHLHMVSGEVWQEFGSVNRIVLGNKLEFVDAKNELTVGGEQKISVGEDQTLHVLGKQDVTIDKGQKTTVTTGDCEINVPAGSFKTNVKSDAVWQIAGDSKFQLSGKKDLITIGKWTALQASAENGVTVGEKVGVWVGAKAEAEIAAYEKISLAGGLEQSFGRKYGINAVGGTVTNVGPAEEKDKTAKKENIALIKEVATKISKEQAKMAKIDIQVNMVSVRMYMFK